MTLKIASLKEISSKYSAYFFDLDGVIWKGPEKINGGVEALNFLRQQKKQLFFLTNSSTRNREMLKDLFKQFGFQARLQEIYPADYITRLYLDAKCPEVKKVMVVGKASLAEQLKSKEREVWHLTSSETLNQMTEVSKLLDQVDKDVGAVVMGYDFQINYPKLCLISFHLQQGAKFIATNPDHYTMISGYRLPGNGSFVACMELASGIKAEVAGKPNPFILEYLMGKFKLNREDCLMIGDNLDTDVQLGRNGGISTLCVLTGNSTEKMVQEVNTATYYCPQLL